jgi:tRNA-dihydrouridine synthase
MILYLAPLQGFTDRVFRNSFSRFFKGFDLSIAPFISALHGGRYKNKELRDVLPENNRLLPVIPQIMGNDPDDFAAVAAALHDLGYTTVNWNLGCPYNMVAKKMKGSGLLCFPDVVDSFLDRVFPMVKTGISIKMRLGRYDHREIFTLMPVLNRYPLEEITIHPRTGVQMYEGTVDLDTFEEACAMCDHPVVYNGDIRSLGDFEKISRRLGSIDRWMIGRGVLTDPFLPLAIKNGSDTIENKVELIRQFHDAYYQERLETLSGPIHVMDRMKSFWSYLAPSLEGGDELFKQIKKVRDPKVYDIRLEEFFRKGTHWIGPFESYQGGGEHP